jgi:hypothetical protein
MCEQEETARVHQLPLDPRAHIQNHTSNVCSRRRAVSFDGRSVEPRRSILAADMCKRATRERYIANGQEPRAKSSEVQQSAVSSQQSAGSALILSRHRRVLKLKTQNREQSHTGYGRRSTFDTADGGRHCSDGPEALVCIWPILFEHQYGCERASERERGERASD